MMRVAAAGLLTCLTPLLVGCGGGSDGGASTGGSAKPAASASAPKGASGGSGGNPVDAQAFCAFLTKIEPKLKADGSKVGAEADLAIELAGWIATHSKPRTAADLDDAASSACPQTRKDVVKLMGGTSFADTLG